MFKSINNISIAWKFLIAFVLISSCAGLLALYNFYSVNKITNSKEFIYHSNIVDKLVNESKFLFNKDRLLLMEMMNPKSEAELEIANAEHLETAATIKTVFEKFTVEINFLSTEQQKNSTLDSLTNSINTFQKYYENVGKTAIDNVYRLQTELFSIKKISQFSDSKENSQPDSQQKINALVSKMQAIDSNVDSTGDMLDSSLSLAGEIATQITNRELQSSQSNTTKLNLLTIIITILIILLCIFFAYYIWKRISLVILKISKNIIEFSKGRILENKAAKSDDEIGKIITASNALGEKMKSNRDFAIEIGRGNFEVEMTNINDQDELGNALIGMRNSLLKAKAEEDNRKLEEEKRNWATAGFAKFGEILRQNNDDMAALSFDIIRNLVEYTGMNQGGLFILNDDERSDPFLEMKSCYAYSRKKFMEKRINIGEGLIGTCFLEKGTILLTDVPDSYINITSGLGEENPRCILIVPLKLNDEVYGIIELASFKILEKHEIDFVEKVGESVASTISSVKVNIRTTLLLEQTQQQAEEMRAQEEEMRQNLEEMQATQEELARISADQKQKDEEIKKKYEEEMENLKTSLEQQQMESEIVMRKKLDEQEKELQVKIEEAQAAEEEVRQNMEEMQALNDNIEMEAKEQKHRDNETKKLYEGEIDLMYNMWMKQLEKVEKIVYK